MAKLGSKINRDELPEDENDFAPLPAGWYEVKITGAEIKETKSGTGEYIKVEYTLIGDNFQGRKTWGMLNIRNDSSVAEEIGRKQLNSLMCAIGLSTLEDTDELLGYDLQIKLKVTEANDKYDASNDVSGFKSIEGGSKTSVEKKPDGDSKKPPWAK